MTLDEWVEKNAEKLRADIKTHVDVYCRDFLTASEMAGLVRMCLISVRDYLDDEIASELGESTRNILSEHHPVCMHQSYTVLEGDKRQCVACGITWMTQDDNKGDK